MGVLRIPLVGDSVNARKPAWIVDGQQRAAALSKAAVEAFHVCVVGFIATSEDEQREQFMLVNSTKPLSKSLIYELLPKTQCLLPPFLEKKRFAAFLLTVLNLDKKSPFYKKIKTSTNPDGIIQDNSILKMLENSLSDGVLYTIQEEYREDAEELVNKMRETLYHYWKAVCETFSTAWSLPPKRSRLTHGAGIVALGFVMDAIADRHRQTKTVSIQEYKHDLEKIAPICRWTHGYWEFGPGDQRRWNDVQNTPTDIRTLERYLLVHYKRLVWNDVLREAD